MYQNKNNTPINDGSGFLGTANGISEEKRVESKFMTRVTPIMKLADGHISGLIAEFSKEFEELPSNAFTEGFDGLNKACDWMEDCIKAAFNSRNTSKDTESGLDYLPLLVPAPNALFNLCDSSAECEIALSKLVTILQRYDLINKICLVFKDNCLNLRSDQNRPHSMQAFRNHGIRMALDWRTSWETKFDLSLARQFDVAIVSNSAFDDDPDLLVRAYEAKLAEIPIIVDGARWRDVDELDEIGIRYVTRAVCDG